MIYLQSSPLYRRYFRPQIYLHPKLGWRPITEQRERSRAICTRLVGAFKKRNPSWHPQFAMAVIKMQMLTNLILNRVMVQWHKYRLPGANNTQLAAYKMNFSHLKKAWMIWLCLIVWGSDLRYDLLEERAKEEKWDPKKKKKEKYREIAPNIGRHIILQLKEAMLIPFGFNEDIGDQARVPAEFIRRNQTRPVMRQFMERHPVSKRYSKPKGELTREGTLTISEERKEEKICRMCETRQVETKMAPCEGHDVMCWKCWKLYVAEYVEKQGRKAKTKAKGFATSDVQVQCPLCREMVVTCEFAPVSL